ncbi:hypothetical protein [Chryseobacterium kwangjuense]|uniref:Uncharacterized protein n=1 Tax=Chryseobacterium kwangjuense TaxID=267125 RepID=A0A135WIM5_9FLAO|nr:hypothetical protein [Chryseobacterium kwangjuense]KXH84612.1 hypothetical protein AU378_02290 [Chryseobacterium kwangjuense]
MKLETLKSEKFRELQDSQMSTIRGGEYFNTKDGGILTIGGVRHTGLPERWTIGADGVTLTKLQVQYNGQWY